MDIDRRTFLGGAAATVVAASTNLAEPGVAHASSQPLTLVESGAPRASVVIHPDADEQVRYAANLLVTYIEKATGAALPITETPPPASGGSIIYVGMRPADSDLPVSAVEGLAPDGFIIHRQTRSVVITGRDSWGTRFGVLDFLERYVDVRWLLPDDVVTSLSPVSGTHVPQRSTLRPCVTNLMDAPAFTSRISIPSLKPYPKFEAWDVNITPGTQGGTWGQYMRGRHTIEMIHRLWSYVPPDVYGDPALPTYRPDFYPIHNGVRYIPPPVIPGTKTGKAGWQPRFTAPGLVDVVADRIIAMQRDDPMRSYSLAVNDSSGFSEDELDWDNLNSAGLPSASVPYYTFVNAVVERVCAEFPDLQFGLLAYKEVADPPPFALHPNVIPYLAHDTFNWLSATQRATDQDLIDRWRGSAQHLGWWDYCFGNPYQLPRMYLDRLQETYAYLHDHGVIGMMIQLRPSWGEGPKPYIIARLLWDPDLNVHRLAHEWYVAAVGPRAAPLLWAYYRLWEGFWTQKVPQSEWFEASHPVFNQFQTAEYLELVEPDELDRARRYIELASSRTQTPEQAGRMAEVKAYADYYDANARSYPRRVDRPEEASQALQLLNDQVDSLDAKIDLSRQRLSSARDFVPRPRPRLAGPGLDWSGWNLYAAVAIAEYLQANEPTDGPVRSRLISLTSDAESPNVRKLARIIIALADGDTAHLGSDMSFEATTGSSWSFDGTQDPQPDTGMTRSGARSLRVPPVTVATISQTIAVQPGFFRFECYIRVPDAAEAAAGHYARLDVRLNNAAGRRVHRLMHNFSLQRAAGSWYRIAVSDLARPGVAQADCRIQIWTAETAVHLDDASVIQLTTSVEDPTVWQTVFATDFDDDVVGDQPGELESAAPETATVQPDPDGGNILVVAGATARVREIDLWHDFGPVEGDVRLTLRMRRDSEPRIVPVTLCDADGTAILKVTMYQGKFWYRDNDHGVTGARYDVGTWYTVQAVLHPDNGTWEAWIDGQAQGSFSVRAGSGVPVQLRIGNRVFALDPAEPWASFDDIVVETAA